MAIFNGFRLIDNFFYLREWSNTYQSYIQISNSFNTNSYIKASYTNRKGHYIKILTATLGTRILDLLVKRSQP